MTGDEAQRDGLTTEGALADDFLSTIGTRIRALRTDRSMTVQQLADRAGISRRLMTQIEHGQANPSLVAVTRIARQLGTEFTQLLAEPAASVPVDARGPAEQTLVWSSAAGSTAHLLHATDTRTADLWRWRLTPGDTYVGQADPDRSEELFYVLDGAVVVQADDHAVTLRPGDSGRLRSDRAYSYRNDGDVDAVFVRVVALAT